MTTRKQLDDFLSRKVGSASEIRAADIRLDSDEEFFLLINALARMAEESPECPFEMELGGFPKDMKSGKYYVPDCAIRRKRRYVAYDHTDRHLIGEKRHYFDTEKGVFTA